jgi:hypothetical protein
VPAIDRRSCAPAASSASIFIEEVRVRIGTLLLLLSIASGAWAGTDVGNGKVYAGPNGVSVTVVPVKAPGEHGVLVAVAGTGSPFDGQLIPHEIVDDGDRTNYETTFHGRRWITLALRNQTMSLNVPGHRDGMNLRFDDKKTAALVAAPLYAAYGKQQADGSLRALMAFDRPAELAARDKEMQASADEVGKICGAKPAVKVDWASFSDDDVKEISIASYCGEPLETMRRMCDGSNEAKRTFAARIKTFRCVMGKGMQLDLAGTTLSWTTARNATNIGEFARAYFEKKL